VFFWRLRTLRHLLLIANTTERLNGNHNYPLNVIFCPECKSMLRSSGGHLKCRKCGFSRKIQTDGKIDTTKADILFCFCHRYRCPHKDYSLCPKDCEEPGPMSRCINPCEFAKENPEECDKITIKLQEAAGVTPENVQRY
jgi:hypothetical protein